MPAKRSLTELEQRKRLLVLEGDLHRAVVRAEYASARDRLGSLRQARSQLRRAGPWLAVGASAVGLLAATRWRRLARWIPAALTAWRWVRRSNTG